METETKRRNETNKKATSDEEIVAALLDNGTIKAAAAALGMPQRTLYDRMESRRFKGVYAEATADVLRGAVCALNSRLEDAVNTVTGIMQNNDTNPAIRLQAAQTIIGNVTKLADRLREDERLVSMYNN